MGKLTNDQRNEIRRLLKNKQQSNITLKEIANTYNVSGMTIARMAKEERDPSCLTTPRSIEKLTETVVQLMLMVENVQSNILASMDELKGLVNRSILNGQQQRVALVEIDQQIKRIKPN